MVFPDVLTFISSSFRRKPESNYCLYPSLQVQSFVSPAASRLLFGMTAGILPFAATRPASLFAPLLRRSAQKVTKKARHRTRRSDSRRANRTALRFSASRGRSDSTVPVLLRDRGDPSPRPFGLIPRSLRCSAPRTAPVVHESVHPCTASLRSFAPLQTWRKSDKQERLLLRQDAAQMGPLWRGERVEEKPEGARARCARGRCAHMDVRSATPGARSRTRRAGCPESALLGVCFFRLPFFAQAKKGDSLARRASESLALQKQHGFPLARE